MHSGNSEEGAVIKSRHLRWLYEVNTLELNLKAKLECHRQQRLEAEKIAWAKSQVGKRTGFFWGSGKSWKVIELEVGEW